MRYFILLLVANVFGYGLPKTHAANLPEVVETNILDYGTITVATINAAIQDTDSGSVVIPEGYYTFTTTDKIILKSNVNLIGMNQKSILDFSGLGATDSTAVIQGDAISNVIIKGLHIITNGGRGIRIDASSGNTNTVTIRENKITSPGIIVTIGCESIGIYSHNPHNTDNIRIENNDIQVDHLGVIVKNDGATGKMQHIYVTNNTFTTNSDAWIPDVLKVDGNSGLVRYVLVQNNILDNSIYDGDDECHGITIDDFCMNVSVKGNVVYNFLPENSSAISIQSIGNATQGDTTGGANILVGGNVLDSNYVHIETDVDGSTYGGTTRYFSNIVLMPNILSNADTADLKDDVGVFSLDENGYFQVDNLLLKGADDAESTLGIGKITHDATHIRYVLSHRSNNKDLYLYSTDATTFKNWMKIFHDSKMIQIGPDTIKTAIGNITPARTLHIADYMRIEPQSDAPGTPSAGDIYYDSDDNKLKCYNGSAWQDLY
ncbi:MAG: hypothetical protein DWQ05_15440 [Calditrichaeota bacterium]|nr:MAG: hypothetical protein DWQ05_15440 [Calditrichota bacterium]